MMNNKMTPYKTALSLSDRISMEFIIRDDNRRSSFVSRSCNNFGIMKVHLFLIQLSHP